MLKLKKIAITGGIASGKTSVCQYFQELGAYVVNADSIVHELLKPNTDLGQKIIGLLGPDIVENGQFNRKAIAEKVFKDLNQLQKFEEVIHPALFMKIEELYKKTLRQEKYKSFVVEISLLFELGEEKNYDAVITVISSTTLARERFEKSGFSKTEYNLRMKRQLNPEIKAKQAQYIIQNNGSLEDLQKKVFELNQIIQQQ